MPLRISSVRHSPDGFLRLFSLLCSFTLTIYSGHYSFALYLVPGTAALLAARHKQIYNPLHCPTTLESQLAHCNITACKHIPKQFTFLEKPLLCVRDPQASKSLFLHIPMGGQRQSGQRKRAPAFLCCTALVQRLLLKWRRPLYLPAGPCSCTQGGGSPSPSRKAAECR